MDSYNEFKASLAATDPFAAAFDVGINNRDA